MTPQAQNVTFVGIGAIGLPMALSVAAAGFDVTGVDFSERQRVAALEQGLPAAADAASAAEADAVIVMVATPDQLSSAALGQDGLVARMRPGSTLIVMSTVGPEAVPEHSARTHGIRSADRVDFRLPLIPGGGLVLRAVLDAGQSLLHRVVDLEVELTLERRHGDGVGAVGEDLAHR